MTSIEALNRIECATDLTKEMRWETIVSNPYGHEFQTVRKDLEVLEILKRGCAYANVEQYLLRQRGKDRLPNIVVDMHIELTEEEYMKVKEWLGENDK